MRGPVGPTLENQALADYSASAFLMLLHTICTQLPKMDVKA